MNRQSRRCILQICVVVSLFVMFGHYSTVHGTSFTYYMSSFSKGSDPDDTGRIRRAMAAVITGTLVFDEGLYTISDTVKLRANVTLQGTTSSTHVTYGGSHIRLTASNKAIFLIGCDPNNRGYDIDDPGNPSNLDCDDYDQNIIIRDLGLSTPEETTGTIGIAAKGDFNTPPGGANDFEFKNILFTNFDFGIKAEALDSQYGWQFDNVRINRCFFDVPNDQKGIYINSLNSGWQISSSQFTIRSRATGIHMERGSYSTIDSIVSNGTAIGTDIAFASIFVKQHGSLRISNSVSEGVDYDVKVEGKVGSTYPIFFPIHLDNNVFQAKVDIESATVISTANQFGLEFGTPGAGSGTPGDHRDDYQKPMPKARENAQVYSFGDKFCFDYVPTTCANQGWEFATGARMMYGIGQFKNITTTPSYLNNYLFVERAPDYVAPDTPLISAFSTTFEPRPLLRLGHRQTGYPDYHYTFTRNSNTGFLEVSGNQDNPYRGVSFNGPVTLPSYLYNSLPNLAYTVQYGSLAYCSDCQIGTPCVSGGSGALALRTASGWACK